MQINSILGYQYLRLRRQTKYKLVVIIDMQHEAIYAEMNLRS